MNKKMENSSTNKLKLDANQVTQRKEYKKPTLMQYGDISELVLMNPGVGMDGGFPPSITIT